MPDNTHLNQATQDVIQYLTLATQIMSASSIALRPYRNLEDFINRHGYSMQRKPIPTPLRHYIGKPLRAAYTLDTVAARGYYGVLDNWQMQWPLLTGVHHLDDALFLPSTNQLSNLRRIKP